MPQLGTKGAELDLLIRQGATLGPFNMKVLTADGNDVDLTSAVFRAEIRRTAESPALAGVTFTFTITTPLEGIVDWEVDADSTTELMAGESETDTESQYVWDMEVELSDGRVLPLLYGKVSVFREVTKVD
jgi:hypothetical protein